MGRSRRIEQAQQVQSAGNSLVASAARVGTGSGAVSFSDIARLGRDWQARAWELYHEVGEFRYACDWIGAMISKAVLFATREVDGKIERVTTGPAFDYVDRLFGDTDGKTEMLRMFGIHMTVAGECFVLGYADPDSEIGAEIWEVISATRLRNVGTDEDPVWMVNGRRLRAANHKEVLVVRIWRPDPDNTEVAISPARAVLTILGEIVKLTQHVEAQVNSRLAGAGILLMPSEMTFPAPPEVQGEDGEVIRRTANNAEDLMAIINDVMGRAIENRSDATALVPIVITAPGEHIDKIKHLTFWSELDAHAIDLRNEAIRRLGLGMDMPPEVLQGLSETNHWSAWQSDESAIKSHTEPLLKIITSSLAAGYLRPLLLTDPDVEGFIEHYSIGADTSEMRQRPNRSKEALELHAMGLLNDQALLRETGFDPENDGLTDEQQKTWFLRKMASGSTTPDQVEAAMRVLFNVDLPAERGDKEVGDEARPTPSLKDHPSRDIPDREIGEARKEAREQGRVPSATVPHAVSGLHGHARVEVLAAASDQIVMRALERAGNKLKSNMQIKPTFAAVDLYKAVEIPSDQVEFLLTDAWAHVPRLAGRYGVDPAKLTAELDHYTAELLRTRSEHSYEALLAHLTGPLEGVSA